MLKLDLMVPQVTPAGVEEDFGFIPRFTAGQAGTTYLSLTEALQSLPSRSLDFPALNVFFRLGMFLNGKTAFREIRRVSPEPVFLPPTTLSRDEVIDAYIDLFRQSVRRRNPTHSVLALSGGCDSRHILLEMHAQRQLPDYIVTVAIPGRPSEVEIAAKLSSRIGVRQVIQTPNPSHCVQDELWKNRACHFTTLDHGWFAGTGQARDSLPWWDGIGGDVLSAGLFLEEWNLRLFEQDKLDELADRLVSRQHVPYFRDQSLFPRTDALSEVRAELAKHRKAPNPVGSFYFWNRTRVAIAVAPFALLAPQKQVTLAPYLDRDLWGLLASLPARMMLDHNLHRDAVRRAYPDFAGTPYFEKKVKLDAGAERTKALRLLGYLGTRKPDLQQILMICRAARAMVLSQHRGDIDWLLSASIYCTELLRLAS